MTAFLDTLRLEKPVLLLCFASRLLSEQSLPKQNGEKSTKQRGADADPLLDGFRILADQSEKRSHESWPDRHDRPKMRSPNRPGRRWRDRRPAPCNGIGGSRHPAADEGKDGSSDKLSQMLLERIIRVIR